MPPKSQMHKDSLLKNFQNPNIDQFSCPTNKCPEFVGVIYDPFIMLDAYWTEEQVESSGLHLGFVHLDAQINLGF